jgi:hypothetical protein
MTQLKTLLVLITITALFHTPLATSRVAPRGHVSPAVMRAWFKVARCETGGDWTLSGPVYSGALGISDANWIKYGGLRFARNAGAATPTEQVIIARRIEGSNYVPDQRGCDGSW